MIYILIPHQMPATVREWSDAELIEKAHAASLSGDRNYVRVQGDPETAIQALGYADIPDFEAALHGMDGTDPALIIDALEDGQAVVECDHALYRTDGKYPSEIDWAHDVLFDDLHSRYTFETREELREFARTYTGHQAARVQVAVEKFLGENE